MKKQKSKMPQKPFSNYFVIILIVILGVILYVNTLGNEMFWDDFDSIINNQYVHDLQHFPKYFSENLIAGSGLGSQYWRPMLLTTFSIQWQLWQDWAPGYHFVNASFHIANAIFLFYILFYLFKNSWLALFTALIFLAHPLQTEAVTYVAGLGDPLSVFFMFLGLLFYLKFRFSEKDAIESEMYYLSLVMYIFALMTKETAIIMPGLIFLADFFFTDKRVKPFFDRLKTSFQRILSFASVGLLYIFLRATVLNFGSSFNLYGEPTPFTENFYYRLFTFFRTLTVYFRLLFLPFNLHMERTVEIATSLSSPSVIVGGGIFVGLLGIAFWLVKKVPIVSFGILWFFVALFPMSNLLIPVNDLIYEHWMYVPMVGVFATVIWLGQQVGKQVTRRVSLEAKQLQHASLSNILDLTNWLQKFLFLLFVFFLVFLSVLTIKRNQDWKDPITFYNQTLEYAPESYRIINNLGMAYADAGDFCQAKKTYKKAIELEPTVAIAYHNLANAYQETGDEVLAIENYTKAISNNPTFINSYVALVDFYLENEEYDEARAVLEGALGQMDIDLDLLFYLADIAFEQEDYNGAIKYLEQALEIIPGDVNIKHAISEIENIMEDE